MQLDGQRYFYVNPLEVDPAVSGILPTHRHVLPQRPRWHACACCPPNLARLITSLGEYLWSEAENTVYSHLFVGNTADTALARIVLETAYPWQGDVRYTVHPHADSPFTLAIHIPGYVKDFTLLVNGEPCAFTLRDGYAYVTRAWRSGDAVALHFLLLPRRIYADPRVRADAGKVALGYGPFIYCFEGVDNGEPLSALRLPREAQLTVLHEPDLLGGVATLHAEGIRESLPEDLYGEKVPAGHPVHLTAIPYYAWSNRGLTPMSVWLRE